MAKGSVEQALLKAKALAGRGDVAQARAVYEGVLADYPGNVRAKEGLAALMRGAEPPAALLNELVGFHRAGRFGELARRLPGALAAHPGSPVLWNLAGTVAARAGKLDEAELAFRRMTDLAPLDPFGHNNLGTVMRRQGKLDAAVACYRNALRRKPDYAAAHYNLGTALKDLGLFDEALESYDRALAIEPGHADSWNNRGNALRARGRAAEALASYDEALRLRPDHAEAWNNRAAVLQEAGRLDEAVESYRKALMAKPDYRSAEAQMLHQLRHMADWSEADRERTAAMRLGLEGEPISPFTMLSIDDDAERQMRRSQGWASQVFRMAALPLPARPQARPERLRIGFFSADFEDHATLRLMAGLLREHDRARFAFRGYSYGRRAETALREMAAKEMDAFVDVAGASQAEIVARAREDALDIAVDLKGYTTDSRSDLFGFRLAPVQIAFLGYPGTMGAAGIYDYLVADRVVIPEATRPFHAERVIYLPGCYQPNDDRRAIAETQTTRADFGLPEDAFVFASFNNAYKIGPREYDIWMRLLSAVDGSVLWLLRANGWAETNLRAEAARRGIDPGRIVFADRVPHAEHLARHRHADLFLDSFACNAHTTASDALWSGLPLVTRPGSQFASRVAASLLTALGMADLAAESDEAYEALALALARDPARLSEVRARLRGTRRVGGPWESARYARAFEAGLDAAHDRYRAGAEPEDIDVAAITAA